MPLHLGDSFPNFSADTTEGPIKFYKWMGDSSWCVLFSHPADFTPVCTTELGTVAKIVPEFTKRNTKVIALSCSSVEDHKAWIADIIAYNDLPFSSEEFPYCIISDPKRDLAIELGIFDPHEKDKVGLPLSCRAVFIISPDKKLMLQIFYPATTGRNFQEIIRVLDSLQVTFNNKIATPVNWKEGGDCMIVPGVSNDDAAKLFPKGFKIADLPSGKSYIRMTPQPDS